MREEVEGRGGGGKKRWKRRGGEEGATSLMIHFKTAATRSGRRNEKSLFECRFFSLACLYVRSTVSSLQYRSDIKMLQEMWSTEKEAR